MRSTRAPRSHGSSAGSRSSPTGSRRAARTRTLLSEWQIYRMLERAQGCVGRVPVPRARAAARGWGGGVARRTAQTAAIAARRRRQVTPSWGARTAGSGVSSKALSGRKRIAFCRRPRERDEDPFGQLALAERHAQVALDELERLLRRGEERPRSGPLRARADGRRRGRCTRCRARARRTRRSPSSRRAPRAPPASGRTRRRGRRSPRSRRSSRARAARSRTGRRSRRR